MSPPHVLSETRQTNISLIQIQETLGDMSARLNNLEEVVNELRRAQTMAAQGDRAASTRGKTADVAGVKTQTRQDTNCASEIPVLTDETAESRSETSKDHSVTNQAEQHQRQSTSRAFRPIRYLVGDEPVVLNTSIAERYFERPRNLIEALIAKFNFRDVYDLIQACAPVIEGNTYVLPPIGHVISNTITGLLVKVKHENFPLRDKQYTINTIRAMNAKTMTIWNIDENGKMTVERNVSSRGILRRFLGIKVQYCKLPLVDLQGLLGFFPLELLEVVEHQYYPWREVEDSLGAVEDDDQNELDKDDRQNDKHEASGGCNAQERREIERGTGPEGTDEGSERSVLDGSHDGDQDDEQQESSVNEEQSSRNKGIEDTGGPCKALEDLKGKIHNESEDVRTDYDREDGEIVRGTAQPWPKEQISQEKQVSKSKLFWDFRFAPIVAENEPNKKHMQQVLKHWEVKIVERNYNGKRSISRTMIVTSTEKEALHTAFRLKRSGGYGEETASVYDDQGLQRNQENSDFFRCGQKNILTCTLDDAAQFLNADLAEIFLLLELKKSNRKKESNKIKSFFQAIAEAEGVLKSRLVVTVVCGPDDRGLACLTTAWLRSHDARCLVSLDDVEEGFALTAGP